MASRALVVGVVLLVFIEGRVIGGEWALWGWGHMSKMGCGRVAPLYCKVGGGRKPYRIESLDSIIMGSCAVPTALHMNVRATQYKASLRRLRIRRRAVGEDE